MLLGIPNRQAVLEAMGSLSSFQGTDLLSGQFSVKNINSCCHQDAEG